MKKIVIIALCLTALLFVQACKSQQPAPPKGMPKGLHDSVSMAVGVVLSQFLEYQIQLPEINYDIVFATMKKIRDGKDVGIDQMQINEIAQRYFTLKQELVGSQNQKEGSEYLANNKTKEGVCETESGLQYKIIEEGTGVSPEATDMVTVHYTGTLIDGTQFDSSVERGEPATFSVNGVIPGWTEGLQLLKEGGKAMLYIPWELGYGAPGSPPVIPPYATLIFEVELIQVVKAEPQPEP